MKLYGLCPHKLKAREETIVKAWRNLTGLQSVPEGRDFWTLCGPMTSPEGGLLEGSELSHMLDTGLLRSADQYHGVERDLAIHKANVKATRRMTPKPFLHHGEIHTVLGEALAKGKLRPAIVNLDTLYMPDRAVRLLGETLYLLNYAEGPIMVVLNIVLQSRYRHFNFPDVIRTIQGDAFCKQQLDHEWVESSEGYTYKGTGQSAVKMGTLIFFQPYKEAALKAG